MQNKLLILTSLFMLPCRFAAADGGQAHFPVVIENHIFTPAEIHVPAGKDIILDVENKDPAAEEFDSSALQVEKVVPGGRKAIVRIKALEAGRYPFVGEYHSNTAKGVVIAE